MTVQMLNGAQFEFQLLGEFKTLIGVVFCRKCNSNFSHLLDCTTVVSRHELYFVQVKKKLLQERNDAIFSLPSV